MARSPKKKAAPAKKIGRVLPKERASETEQKVVRPRPARRASETEQKAVQRRPARVFRGTSETEGKAVAPAQKARRAPPRTKKSVTKKTPIKKASQAPSKKVVRDKRGRVRDYKKEYEKRLQRGEMLQRPVTEQPSKAVSRGHPRREKGEIGLAELRQLRHAVSLPSPGEQRRNGVKNPVQFEERVIARAFIAEIAGVPIEVVTSTKSTRRSPEAERFAEIFVAMGLGSLVDAYTLYFSP